MALWRAYFALMGTGAAGGTAFGSLIGYEQGISSPHPYIATPVARILAHFIRESNTK